MLVLRKCFHILICCVYIEYIYFSSLSFSEAPFSGTHLNYFWSLHICSFTTCVVYISCFPLEITFLSYFIYSQKSSLTSNPAIFSWHFIFFLVKYWLHLLCFLYVIFHNHTGCGSMCWYQQPRAQRRRNHASNPRNCSLHSRKATTSSRPCYGNVVNG